MEAGEIVELKLRSVVSREDWCLHGRVSLPHISLTNQSPALSTALCLFSYWH